METTNIVNFARRDKMTDALAGLPRTGSQKLIAQAVEAEFSDYMLICVRRQITRLSYAMGIILSPHFKRALAM